MTALLLALCLTLAVVLAVLLACQWQAARMWRIQASRSAWPMAKGKWRMRRRGWPRSSE